MYRNHPHQHRVVLPFFLGEMGDASFGIVREPSKIIPIGSMRLVYLSTFDLTIDGKCR